MREQEDLRPYMREALVDWLIELNRHYGLEGESVYLTVTIVDRYLSLRRVPRTRLQLVGATAFFIAFKYIVGESLSIQNLLYLTDDTYSPQDVIELELGILSALEFRISAPTAFPFMLRFLSITQATKTVRFAAMYYLERSLQELDFVWYPPPLAACASVCLAINHVKIREHDAVVGDLPLVPQVILRCCGYLRNDIVDVARRITQTLVADHTLDMGMSRTKTAVYDKFNTASFDYVSSAFDPPRYQFLI
jgi:hypothetical protein